MATYVDILKREFPEIDTELFDYITGVLDSGATDFEDGEEVFDAVGGVLQEVSADSKNEDDIRDICLQILSPGFCSVLSRSSWTLRSSCLRCLQTPVRT
uniref:ABCF3 PWI-like helical bundle domain-containing protein n=1 Tax=Kryptolebias marmoratus TaxID=37003 RepID=A0A3Q3G8H4_KRYMA